MKLKNKSICLKESYRETKCNESETIFFIRIWKHSEIQFRTAGKYRNTLIILTTHIVPEITQKVEEIKPGELFM